jgi:hypothetical protein
MPSFSRGCVVCITPVDSWLSSSTCDAYCKVSFMRNWLDAQHEAAKYWNNKPVLLAEYKCAHNPVSHCTHRVSRQCVAVRECAMLQQVQRRGSGEVVVLQRAPEEARG